MTGVVEVKLWGTTIGHLGYSPGQSQLATFEYADSFLQSGIQVSPLMLPLPVQRYEFPDISQRTFKGVPGIFSDSLPDKYGDQLIDLFMADKGISPQEITTLDRLLYVGCRGLGALEYHPDQTIGDANHNIILDAHTLAELAAIVVSHDANKREKLLNAVDRTQALKFIRISSSAGGARSKALVARDLNGNLKDGTELYDGDHTYWLMKFDSEGNQDRDNVDPKGMTKVEYVYAQLAGLLDINIPSTDFITDGDSFHYLIERFDRVNEKDKTEKRHYASWSGMAHAHRDATGVYSYEQLALVMRNLNLGQSALTELYKRAIFNVVGRNQDDHTKNTGFLMDKGGNWTLAPAFDLTYVYDPQGKWTQDHQIKLAGKQTDFARTDLLQFGETCGLSKKQANQLLDDTLDVFNLFKEKAVALDIDKQLINTITKHHRMDLTGSVRKAMNVKLSDLSSLALKSDDKTDNSPK